MATISYNMDIHSEITGTGLYRPQITPLVLADYHVITDEPQRLILTNRTSPLGLPERVEIQFSEVKDVYSTRQDIDRPLYAASRRGSKGYIKDTLTFTKTDPVTGNTIALPVKVSMMVETINDADLTDDLLEFVYKRIGAILHPVAAGNDTPNYYIPLLLRGAIDPIRAYMR
jgi:hypothetical protein